jgi:phytoene dehydrogenase-like protein
MKGAITDSGSEIKFRTRCLAIEIEQGRVKAIDTSEGVVEPEALVYAAPLQQLFRIASPDHFPDKLIKKIKHMEPVAGVSIDCGLREKICGLNGWMIDPEQGIMGKFQSNTDPDLAPAGKQLSSWLIVIPPEQMSDPETVRSAIHRLRTQVKKLFPDFFAVAEFERILALSIIDGVCMSPKQSIVDRPGVAVPGIENLFLAGDCVAAPGASGEIALGSGIEASLKVAQFLGQGS